MARDQDPTAPAVVPRIAVLIDADNAQPSIADALLAEVARFGASFIRRAYGDWTTPNLAGWKPALLNHAIQPVQQFRYTVGKNATDSAMIIDTMDLLHSRRLDGFCLVSSDSDFTGLARRVREEGLLAIGVGERKTPRPFVAACDRFIYTDLLAPATKPDGDAVKAPPTPARDKKLIELLANAVDAASDEAGWAHLGTVGTKIYQQSPEFDSRSWGFAKLGDLFAALPMFQTEERGTAGARTRFVRRADPGSPRAKRNG